MKYLKEWMLVLTLLAGLNMVLMNVVPTNDFRYPMACQEKLP